jgi:DNA-binding transcriptional regulator YiaG
MTDTTPQTFGQRLKAARHARGLTQVEVAWHLRCDVDRVRDWEQDRWRPSPRYQTMLDDILGPIDQENDR